MVLGFLILKMFPPSQTVFVFNQWSFLFLETKFSKTWTFPRGQKKERNQNRSRFFDFENVSSFTNRVGFPPIVVFFQNVDIPNETKNADHVLGFLTFHSFVEHGCPENPETSTSPGTVTKSKFTSHEFIIVSRKNLFSSFPTI